MIAASVRIIYNHMPRLDSMLREETKQGSAEFGEKLLNDIKANAPVRTGALRDGMKLRQVSGMAAVHVIVESEQPYWQWVEYGTSRRAAHPFIAPAVQANLPELREVMKRHVIEACVKSAGPAVS